MTNLVDILNSAMGKNRVLTGRAIKPQHISDRTGIDTVRLLAVFPHATSEVSSVLHVCNRCGQAVVPQGGLTGLTGTPSHANLLFFHAREDASELAKRLFPYGVIVKPRPESGCTKHLRVSIGSPKHNDQFLAALAQAAQPR
jgi:hypothetical protein